MDSRRFSYPGEVSPKEVGEAAVITGSVLSGGLIGVAITVAAQELAPPWNSAVVTLAPTITAAWSVLIAGAARLLKRRYHSKSWHLDRQRLLEWLDVALPAARQGVSDTSDKVAKKLFAERIARLERLKAVTLTAIPFERPWETEGINSPEAKPEISSAHAVPES